ncbi:DNA topoisomerase 2-associated protein pat1 [Rhodotorula kratochvilovae]
MADPYGDALTEDLAVYSFDALDEHELLGHDEHALAHLLDERLNDLNDETFGTADDQQRDFDFAGNTERFLGTDAAAHLPAGAGKQLQPMGTEWGGALEDPLLSATTPAARTLSPWTSLNDDPLLARATPVVLAQPSQPAAPPSRQFKTLEEVEAEMRVAAAARQAQPPVPAPRGMTVEELEADLRRQQQQQAQQMQQTPQLQAPHLPPGMSPQPGAMLPPGLAAQGGPFPPPPPGALPQGFPPLPPLPPQIAALPPHLQAQFLAQMVAQGRLPPHVLAPFGGPPPPGFVPGHPGAAGSRPASLSGQPGMPAVAVAQGSPALAPQLAPQVAAAAQAGFPAPPPGPGTPGPGFPPLGAQGPLLPAGNPLATLFPPLPSQAGAAPAPTQPGTLAQVEQQLHLLSLHQGAQHPSLTGAQLQALLAQAHSAAAAAGAQAAEGPEDEKTKAGEELIRRVEERIVEHERAEAQRKKKALKIASMAKHNNLMSNSDKDFITRIQVSQLVTDDPYADDFYFHIMAAIKHSRLAAQGILPPPGAPGAGPNAPPAGPGGPSGGGNRRPTRRENAMNRMAQNVQRLVDSAKKRNAHAPATLSLDGALGKIATRTRSAPRPLLQVRPSTAAVKAAPGGEKVEVKEDAEGGVSTGQSLLAGAGLIAAPSATPAAPARVAGPLSHRDALVIIEKVYDCVLDLEQLRRIQPQLHGAEAALRQQLEQMTVEGEVKAQLEARCAEANAAVRESEDKYRELVARLWDNLHVMDPLDACTPHPFISLLAVTKGKRILPRAIRHLSPEQTLTLLTLLVATFDTLDVVVDAPLLDQLDSATSAEGRARRAGVEQRTETLLNAIVAPVMAVVGQAPLRMVTGMIGLLMDRNNLVRVVRSKPGLAFLTILLSRAESLKQAQGDAAPDAADLEQWHRTFTHLFGVLETQLLALFPSSRLAASLPFGVAQYQSLDALRPQADADDEPVWRFLAAVAVCADPDQQQGLVTGVRDKVIEGVRAARQGAKAKGAQAVAPEKAALKIRNVNLLLHALSLDASMIETDDE